MIRNTIVTLLIMLTCTISGCHYEKYVVKSKPYSDVKKHTLLTTRDTDRKLDIPLQEETEESRFDILNINLNNYPRHYFGFATIVAVEEDLILNLKFSSDHTSGDTMYIEGNFSDNNKRSFENISIVIPLEEVDQKELVSIASNSITLQAFLDVKYIFDRVEITDSNEIRDNDIGFIQEELMTRDTLTNREILKVDSLDNEQFEPSSVVFSNINIYQNNESVFAFSGEFEYEGVTFKLVSQSDPLPLIPILVAAFAGVGIYEARDYLKKIGVESKNKITAFVDRIRRTDGNNKD